MKKVYILYTQNKIAHFVISSTYYGSQSPSLSDYSNAIPEYAIQSEPYLSWKHVPQASHLCPLLIFLRYCTFWGTAHFFYARGTIASNDKNLTV